MQRCQFSSVSPSMPAMRSMLICGKPMLRAYAYDLRDFRRPVRAAVHLENPSSKFSTPRLRRVTPRRRMTSSLASVSVPGSHSNVISSADDHGVSRRQPRDERRELLRREKRRRAAAEIDEVDRRGPRAPAARAADPIRAPAGPGTARPAARSCPCTRGSSRNGNASGRTGCAGTARAARPGSGRRASAGSASRPTASAVQVENGG